MVSSNQEPVNLIVVKFILFYYDWKSQWEFIFLESVYFLWASREGKVVILFNWILPLLCEPCFHLMRFRYALRHVYKFCRFCRFPLYLISNLSFFIDIFVKWKDMNLRDAVFCTSFSCSQFLSKKKSVTGPRNGDFHYRWRKIM